MPDNQRPDLLQYPKSVHNNQNYQAALVCRPGANSSFITSSELQEIADPPTVAIFNRISTFLDGFILVRINPLGDSQVPRTSLMAYAQDIYLRPKNLHNFLLPGTHTV
ncbi:MAG TPA: hypothetical protein VGL10_01625 [Gammaproteobacteria bacterium]